MGIYLKTFTTGSLNSINTLYKLNNNLTTSIIFSINIFHTQSIDSETKIFVSKSGDINYHLLSHKTMNIAKTSNGNYHIYSNNIYMDFDNICEVAFKSYNVSSSCLITYMEKTK